MSNNPYRQYDCDTRDEYLHMIAEEYNVPISTVYALADMLGPSEDFDGLIIELEDFNGDDEL